MKDKEIDKIISGFTDFSRFFILMILYEGPIHGYSIKNKFEERLGKNITTSLVYPFLHDLERKKLLTHTMESVGKKQRKVYELTKKGKKVCRKLFKRFSAIVATAIKSSLRICAHCGSQIFEGGHVEKVVTRRTMFCCKYCAASYKLERKK